MELEPLSKKKRIIIWSACIGVFVLITVLSGLFLYKVREEAKNVGNFNKVNWSLSKQPNAEASARVRNLSKLTDWKTEKKLIEQARNAEPDNAYIELHAIRLLAPQAFTVKHTEDDPVQVILEDQELADETVKAIKNFLRKKEFKSYLLDEYLELKDENKSFSGLLQEVSVAFNFLFPELSSTRSVTRFYLAYNNPDEKELKSRAIELTEFCKKLFKESRSILEILVSASIAGMTRNQLKAVNEDFFHEEIKKLNFIYRLGNSIKRNKDFDMPISKMDTLSKMVLPAFAAPENFEEKLKNSRRLEFAYFDSITISALSQLAVFLAFSMIMVIIRWQFTSEPHKPYLIFPEKKYIFQSIGVSLLAIVLFLSVRHFLPSREFGITYRQNPIMYACEITCFFIAAFIIPCQLLLDGLRKKFQDNLPYPDRRKGIYFILTAPIVLMLCSSFFYSPDMENNFLRALPCLPAFALILYYALRIFYLLLQKKYADWHGSSARLVILSLAVFGVFIFLLPMTVFKWCQAYHYEKEKLIRVASDIGYVVPYSEAEILQKITKRIDVYEELPELEREKKADPPEAIIYLKEKPAVEEMPEADLPLRSRRRALRERETEKN